MTLREIALLEKLLEGGHVEGSEESVVYTDLEDKGWVTCYEVGRRITLEGLAALVKYHLSSSNIGILHRDESIDRSLGQYMYPRKWDREDLDRLQSTKNAIELLRSAASILEVAIRKDATEAIVEATLRSGAAYIARACRALGSVS